MDFSSNPRPATTVMLPNLARNRKPERPAKAPEMMKARKDHPRGVDPGHDGGVGVGSDRIEAPGGAAGR
jgi:hypothetical protein